MTTLHDHFFHLVNCAIVLWSKKPLNESEPLLKFYRFSIANSLVYSEGYGRIKKRNSYTVAYYKYNDRTTKYGKVLYFLHVHSVVALAVLQEYEPIQARMSSPLNSRIVPVKEKNSSCVVNV